MPVADLFKWSNLKLAVNSRFAKLTAIVPIIGWILLADDVFLKLVAKYLNEPSIKDPSWKVYALHAGLSMYGLGVTLFYLICPEVIKSYISFNDYVEKESQILTSSRLDNLTKKLKGFGVTTPDKPSEAESSIGSPPINSSTGRDFWYRKNQDHILSIQNKYYDHQNSQRLVGMIIVLFFLIIGSILAIIPSINAISHSLHRFIVLILS